MHLTPARLPLDVLPGYDHWGRFWPQLVELQQPIWIWGPPASGVSLVARTLADARGVAFLDDVDQLNPDSLGDWVHSHPKGVVGAHEEPGEGLLDSVFSIVLPSLADQPDALSGLLKAMALAEGMGLPLPPALSNPPCPSNLRSAHNRVLRWKLLGQLPEEAVAPQVLPLEEDSIATNLHLLERLLLHRALRRSYGNRVEAARRLGVSRRQLYLLIERHGDPLRAEAPISEGPKRLLKARSRQNSSQG